MPRLTRLLGLLLVPASLTAQSDSAPPPPAPPATAAAALPERSAHGAFTEQQATMGEQVFMSYCASCHAPDFHTGEQFRFSWYGRTVLDYFRIIKRTMPEDNPGGLSDDDYTRVIAYILKLNGFATGPDSLKSDTLDLKRTRIIDPSPSPDSSKTP